LRERRALSRAHQAEELTGLAVVIIVILAMIPVVGVAF